MSGQSIGDRIVAAQHTIIGSDMSKSVCKASTSEVMGPKKKHLDYLHALTNEPNINIPELADSLVERSKKPQWVVVFKALITTHHLMCYGNEKFLQHVASRNSLFTLSHFIDKSGVQSYDMSTYIRKYSQYLNEKAVSYRTVAYDFTRIRRGKDGFLRSLETDKLLKALPVLQHQLDALLEFDASPNELTNGVINAAFMITFKDLIRLFACYNDGIINLLEKFFSMKKNQCKEALDVYKKFLIRMNKVSELLKVAEQVGIDKGEIPDLTKAPSSLLDALEQHVASLEGKKTDLKHFTSTDAHVSSLKALNTSLQKIDESTQQHVLDEEKMRLEAFKKKRDEEMNLQDKVSEIVATSSTTLQQPSTSAASSDLLEIFGGSVTNSAPSTTTDAFGAAGFSSFPQSTPSNPAQASQPFVMTTQQAPGFGMGISQTQQPFAISTNPNAAAASQQNMFGFDQTPAATNQPNLFVNSPFNNPSTDANGFAAADLLQPTVIGQQQASQPQLTSPSQQGGSKDLESSLADVMANLTVGGQKANRDFEPKGEKKLTGGVNYNPTFTPSPVTYNSSPMHAMAPGMMPQQRMPMYGANMIGNMMMPAQQPATFGMQYQQPYQQVPPRPFNPNNPFGSM